jgi:methylisocitrate lyase
MVAKVRAAVDARGPDGPLVIARSDAFRAEGLEGVIARARRYVAAGADAFFPECATMSDEDLKIIGQEVDAALVVAMVEGASGPFLSAAELESMGYNLVLFPNALLRSFGAAGRRVLRTLAEDGTTAAMMPQMLTFTDLMELLGYPAMRAWEQQWSTERTEP